MGHRMSSFFNMGLKIDCYFCRICMNLDRWNCLVIPVVRADMAGSVESASGTLAEVYRMSTGLRCHELCSSAVFSRDPGLQLTDKTETLFETYLETILIVRSCWQRWPVFNMVGFLEECLSSDCAASTQYISSWRNRLAWNTTEIQRTSINIFSRKHSSCAWCWFWSFPVEATRPAVQILQRNPCFHVLRMCLARFFILQSSPSGRWHFAAPTALILA